MRKEQRQTKPVRGLSSVPGQNISPGICRPNTELRPQTASSSQFLNLPLELEAGQLLALPILKGKCEPGGEMISQNHTHSPGKDSSP